MSEELKTKAFDGLELNQLRDFVDGLVYDRTFTDEVSALFCGIMDGRHWHLEAQTVFKHIALHPQIHHGDNVFTPSMAGWVDKPQKHTPLGADLRRDGDRFNEPPQWICEFLSEPGMQPAIEAKLPHYYDMGVQTVWIVDTALRHILASRRTDEPRS